MKRLRPCAQLVPSRQRTSTAFERAMVMAEQSSLSLLSLLTVGSNFAPNFRSAGYAEAPQSCRAVSQSMYVYRHRTTALEGVLSNVAIHSPHAVRIRSA